MSTVTKPMALDETLQRVADALEEIAEGGGGGGTSDYEQLTNKPSINSVPLLGNKTLLDLGIHSFPSGGSLGQVIGKLSNSDYDYGWVTPSASGGSTNILIAASNSSVDLKDKADYVCTGENDQVIINTVLESMTNGEVCLLAGDYYISGEINPVSNVDIKGHGNPILHLTNRVVTTLAQAAAVDDETIYLTDPSNFVVGQKISIKWGTNANDIDVNVGHIKTIDYETGAVTMYARANGGGTGDVKETAGKVGHSADAGSYVFTDSCVVMAWNVDNVTVSGLTIDGNSSNLGDFASDTDYGSNLIEWKGGSNVRILRNKLTNCYKHSVLFVYGTTNSFVCENIIISAGTHGIDFYTNVERNFVFGNFLTEANIQCHGGLKTIIANNHLKSCCIFNTGGKYNLIIGNEIDNTNMPGARGIQLTGNGNKYVQVVGNVFIGGNGGIQSDNTTDTKISSNKFIEQRAWAIDLYASKSCSVDNNKVYLPNSNEVGSAIVIENSASKNVVTGNVIHGTESKTSVGIEEKGSSADYSIIANNIMYDVTTGVTKVGTHSAEQNNIVAAS